MTVIPHAHPAPAADKLRPFFTTVSPAAKHSGHFGRNIDMMLGQERSRGLGEPPGGGGATSTRPYSAAQSLRPFIVLAAPADLARLLISSSGIEYVIVAVLHRQ